MKTKELKKQVKKVQKNAEKEFKKFRTVAQSKFNSIGKSAGKEMVKAKDELEELEGKVKDYIKKNPEKLFIAAVGVGAFVGALTATLLKRKGKKKGK